MRDLFELIDLDESVCVSLSLNSLFWMNWCVFLFLWTHWFRWIGVCFSFFVLIDLDESVCVSLSLNLLIWMNRCVCLSLFLSWRIGVSLSLCCTNKDLESKMRDLFEFIDVHQSVSLSLSLSCSLSLSLSLFLSLSLSLFLSFSLSVFLLFSLLLKRRSKIEDEGSLWTYWFG